MAVTPSLLIVVALLSQTPATVSPSAWDDAQLQKELRLVDRWTEHDQRGFGDFKSVSALPCLQENTLRSLNSEMPTLLKISNEHCRAVRTFWIDYHGKRVRGETIRPGASTLISTFVTHPFVILDDAGNCIAVFQPVKGPGHARVRP